MRYASLLAVGVLAVILAASSLSPVAAFQGIRIEKVTTNGDTTTPFAFAASGPPFQLKGGEFSLFTQLAAGDHEFTEDAPPGWVLTDVTCTSPGYSTFTDIPNGIIVHYVDPDAVTCTFTNSPAAPVGGVVMLANNFAIVAPWLALIALVGCIGTVVVVAKRRFGS